MEIRERENALLPPTRSIKDSSRRKVCHDCRRPLSVCVCSHIPEEKFQTRTRLVVLQHPYEAKRRLGTAAFLPLCLQDYHLIPGRKFSLGSSPELDALLLPTCVSGRDFSGPSVTSAPLATCPCGHTRLLLYPSPDATPLQDLLHKHPYLRSVPSYGNSSNDKSHPQGNVEVAAGAAGSSEVREASAGAASSSRAGADAGAAGGTGRRAAGGTVAAAESGVPGASKVQWDCRSEPQSESMEEGGGGTATGRCNTDGHDVTLVLFDATWQHAREMAKASQCYLDGLTLKVCLPFSLSIPGPAPSAHPLVVRKEPSQGFVSTLEAVARALQLLEPSEAPSKSLLGLLAQFVAIQDRHRGGGSRH